MAFARGDAHLPRMLTALVLLVLADVTSVPATVHENMLFVQVRVDGGAPKTFLVDTAVPRTFAGTHLGLKADVEAELDIGGRRVRVPKIGVMDLGFFAVTEDLPLDGILGMDVFQQFAVEMDFDSALVRLHDAADYRYDGGGEVVSVTIEKSKPFLRARLKMRGKPERIRTYLLDTGSGGSLSDELFKPDGEPIGPDLGRAEYVKIGSFRFDGANGTTGGMRIGGELLKRFNLIADFSRSRIILEPSRHFRDALLFDTSGLELENDAAGLKIAQVYKRTPAADAGLAPGDLITAIDNQPTRTLGLTRVRLMFHQVRTHRLTVLRGGKEMTVTLALRKLL